MSNAEMLVFFKQNPIPSALPASTEAQACSYVPPCCGIVILGFPAGRLRNVRRLGPIAVVFLLPFPVHEIAQRLDAVR
jgi:hypothetical protein